FKIAVLTFMCAPSCFSADPALTIYNQQFAVIRETIALDLKSGVNQVAFTGATAHLEPESVMLRDPSGRRVLRIVEQNYRADPVSLEALLKFTGEDSIDHTPKDEKIRVFTGAAFDLTGERKRTIFRNDMGRSEMDEAFEIKLRNHKKEPVEVRVVEHLYRWNTWIITSSSVPYTKTDAQTIEFRANLQPDEERTIT